MKTLIKSNEFGISVLNKDESIVISSRTVAEVFGKAHSNVLKDIDRLIDTIKDCENSSRVNFYSTSYIDSFNRKQREYLLNAFTLLVMGII